MKSWMKNNYLLGFIMGVLFYLGIYSLAFFSGEGPGSLLLIIWLVILLSLLSKGYLKLEGILSISLTLLVGTILGIVILPITATALIAMILGVTFFPLLAIAGYFATQKSKYWKKNKGLVISLIAGLSLIFYFFFLGLFFLEEIVKNDLYPFIGLYALMNLFIYHLEKRS